MAVRYLSVREYAELMGLNESAVRRMCANGVVSCMKVGGLWRIALYEPSEPEPDPAPLMENACNMIADACAAFENLMTDIGKKVAELSKERV